MNYDMNHPRLLTCWQPEKSVDQVNLAIVVFLCQ